MYEIWIPIIISVASLAMAVFAFYRARPIEQKQYDSESMLTSFRILSDEEMRRYKKIISEERRTLVKENRPLVFNRTEAIVGYADKIEESYNEVSALYQHNLLNKEHFKSVYGGGLVVWWKILRADIDAKQTPRGSICKHFKEVAQEFMDSGIDDEPY